ncbi:protein of unknown function [Methylacidimicrobium sp. AP8]|nr:protein of unknown function [Methylacidimicrobium sp. AP8]
MLSGGERRVKPQVQGAFRTCLEGGHLKECHFAAIASVMPDGCWHGVADRAVLRDRLALGRRDREKGTGDR